MQLFTTQLNDIQSQIEALQAERNRLQDLENATAGALANLKAVVANVEGDEEAIATIKSAINDLFAQSGSELECEHEAPIQEAIDKDKQDFVQEFKSEVDAQNFIKLCKSGDVTCEGYEIERTRVTVVNSSEDRDMFLGLVDDLDAYFPEEDELEQFINTHERELESNAIALSLAEALEYKYQDIQVDGCKISCADPYGLTELEFNEFIDNWLESEFKPKFTSNGWLVVDLNEQAKYCLDDDTLTIRFKLKKAMKKWEEHYSLTCGDATISSGPDTSVEGYKYFLQVERPSGGDPTEWMKRQAKLDFTLTPEENREQQSGSEKYHVLIQKDQQSETVEIKSSDEAVARKNYQHLVKSLPDSYVSLMSNKRGCIESHKPAVQQTLPKTLPSDVVDEEIETPAFSFMATGMGWLNVIHEGEVLGPIYSNNEGWELETGEQFETREEAAQALFNSTPSAA